VLERDARIARAVALLALACIAVLGVGILYLRPTLSSLYLGAPAANQATARPGLPWSGIVGLSFGDAEHGVVQLVAPAPISADGLQVTYVTADGGQTWSRLPSPPGYTFVGPRRLIDPTTGGVRISEDGGRTWRKLTDPRHGLTSALYYTPTFIDSQHGWWLDSYTAAAPQSVSLWRTRDGGRMWTELESSGIPDVGAKSPPTFSDQAHGFITVNPVPPADGAHTLLATDDGGDTWHQVASLAAPPSGSVMSGPVVLTHGARVVAAAAIAQGVATAPSSATLTVQVVTMVSEDGGRTWGPARAGPVIVGPRQYIFGGALPVLASAGRLVLLDGRRLWTSADGGVAWSARLAEVPEGTYPIGPLRAASGALFVLAVSRPIPAAIAATAASLFPQQVLVSRDGGVHWKPVPLPKPGA
jgi:photosystem II stability/assembly factor-like uncharacterized protein